MDELDHGVAVDVAQGRQAGRDERAGDNLEGKAGLVEIGERHGTLLAGERSEMGPSKVCRQGTVGRERCHG